MIALKINGKQIIKMPKKVNMLDSNVCYDSNTLCYKKKINLLFTIYVDLESV